MTLKITSQLTNDQLGVYEITLSPGTTGAQLHYHRFMDEAFIVTRGVLTIGLIDGEKTAPEGTVIYAPRFTPHAFRNNSDQDVTVMLLFTPGQSREGFFRGLKETLSEKPVDPEKLLKLYNKYDSFPVDPNNMLPASPAE
jgi:quercetin dioxygenase-like cupin family protein